MEEINNGVLTIQKISNEKQNWCVYLHTNKINGKKYVGITGQNPEDRWRRDGKGYRTQKYFWRAIQKYGWNNFKHEVVLYNETFKYACAVEKCLIKHYKSNDPRYGYNLTDGGEGVSGRTPWNYGIPMSDEMKEIIRKANTGRKISEETRKKLINAKKGKPPNNAGRPMSDETKRKLSMSLIGRVFDDETKQKISNSKKGKYTGVDSSRHHPIYCVELNEIFWGAKAVKDKYGFTTCNIGACCRGERNYANKHPDTGEKLHWIYCDDAIKNGYITSFQLDNYYKGLMDKGD